MINSRARRYLHTDTEYIFLPLNLSFYFLQIFLNIRFSQKQRIVNERLLKIFVFIDRCKAWVILSLQVLQKFVVQTKITFISWELDYIKEIQDKLL